MTKNVRFEIAPAYGFADLLPVAETVRRGIDHATVDASTMSAVGHIEQLLRGVDL